MRTCLSDEEERRLWNWWLIDPRHLPIETDRERYNRQQLEALDRVRERHEAEWSATIRRIREAYLAEEKREKEAASQAPPKTPHQR